MLAAVVAVTSGCFKEPPPAGDGEGPGSSGTTTASGCDQGSLGCACFPNGTCSPGLVCNLGVCEPFDAGTTATATATATTTAVADSTTGEPSTTTGEPGTTTGDSSTGEPPPAHILFTSSAQRTGSEVGGLRGADRLCTTLGQALREGPWVAVLSDANAAAADRISVVGEVVNTQGALLAVDEDELLSGTVQAIPGYDENGAAVPDQDLAWTGSSVDDCAGWMSDDPDVLGTMGLPTTTDRWLDSRVLLPCSASVRLYCLSQ